MPKAKWVMSVGAILLAACADYRTGGGGPGDPCGTDTPCQQGLFCAEEGVCMDGRVLFDTTWDLDPIDVLVVMDNSGGMAPKQLALAPYLAKLAAAGEFGMVPRVAVVTTGVASAGCPSCSQQTANSCINEGGESGALETMSGQYLGNGWSYTYVTSTDSDCPLVVDRNHHSCLYDDQSQQGRLLTGDYGCGYERGLEAMRLALLEHADWLRKEARLQVVVVSDEEDCGAVGDVVEGSAAAGMACYYAAAGKDPEGNTSDPEGKPYLLTPVSEYRDFLLSLKGGDAGKVYFIAVVGVEDPAHPESTQINYVRDQATGNWQVAPACEIPGCRQACVQGDIKCLRSCQALPGTRYIELAKLLDQGQSNRVASICDRADPPPGFVGCPRVFDLSQDVGDAAKLLVLVNGQPLPSYYCPGESANTVVACSDTGAACPGGGECRRSWSYDGPDDTHSHGTVTLDDYLDLCGMDGYGFEQHVQVVELQ